MKYEQANQPLHRIPFSPLPPPLIQNRRCSCELQIDVLQSLKVLRPGYWEDLQFNNTSKLASRGLCFVLFFLKKKKWLHREREKEREKKEKKERKRANTSIDLHRERFAGRLEQIFRDGGESESRGQRGGDSASGERSHIHHHLFVYIEATNHLDESAKGRNRKENL